MGSQIFFLKTRILQRKNYKKINNNKNSYINNSTKLQRNKYLSCKWLNFIGNQNTNFIAILLMVSSKHKTLKSDYGEAWKGKVGRQNKKGQGIEKIKKGNKPDENDKKVEIFFILDELEINMTFWMSHML